MNDLIEKFIARNNKRKPKIAVVGDCFIDEYYYVDANRVSPEFPVPVLLSKSDVPNVVVPAGSGNVCMQFKYWNIDLQLFSLLDINTNNVLIENCINVVDSKCLEMDSRCPEEKFHCPIKKRYYQGQFPLCRLDVEEPNYGLTNLDVWKQELQEAYFKFKPEVAIFSDYDKGVFNGKPLKWFNDEGNTITIVDPKKGPPNKWQGCTIFKPNQKEAEELSDYRDWKNQCNQLQKLVNCIAVVITLGGDGVVGSVGGRHFEYRPNKVKRCESSIGAGDCFSAFLAMTMAHNFDIMDAVKIAFEAGSAYVLNRHNQPVSPYDLYKHIDPISAKYVTYEFLAKRDKNKKLIFTNGVFDAGLTENHVRCLQQAKQLGDELVVALNSDASVKRIKGENRPIMSLKERMRIMASLDFVDYVVSFDEDTPLLLIQKILPSIVVKGGVYRPEEVVGYGVVDVIILDKFNGMSTTDKIRKINDLIL